jgi:chromosome partitioning protein
LTRRTSGDNFIKSSITKNNDFMKTILITSQKGGSGKTMLAAHLAVEAERSGDGPTWLIDTDRQATLTLWHQRRKEETPGLLEVPFTRIAEGLAKLSNQGAAYCFVDTAPTLSDQNAVLLGSADLVLIPVRPSPSDLWAVADTVERVKAASKPFVFVITQAKPQANITSQAIAALSEHGRVTPAFIADRVAYAAAMTGGNTAPELAAKGPAALQIAGLWVEIKSCFHEKMKLTKKVNHG